VITAIDSRFGLKEERPAVSMASAKDPHFSKIFAGAVGHEPPAAIARLKSPSSPSDRQIRTRFAEKAGQPRAPVADDPRKPSAGAADRTDNPVPSSQARAPADTSDTSGSGSEASAADEAAGSEDRPRAKVGVGRPGDPRTAAASASLIAQGGVAMLPGKIQDPATAGAGALTADDAAVPEVGTLLTSKNESALGAGVVGKPVDAQIGAAAYRLSPHGPTEARFAQAAGAAQPHPEGEALDGQTLLDGRNAVRDPAAPPDPQMEGGIVLDARGMVELSNRLRKAALSTDSRKTDDLPPEAEQTRDQVLNRIGGPAVGGDAAGEAARSLAAQAKVTDKDLPAKVRNQNDKHPDPQLLASAGTSVSGLREAAATPSPAAATPSADPKLIDQVVKEARWLIGNRQSEVTMKLEPKDLGELHLKVTQKDGVLSVEMIVNSSAAKHLLDAGMADLRQRLQADQLPGGNILLQVDVRKDDGGQSTRQFARQDGEGSAIRGITGPEPVEAPTAPGAARKMWGHNVSIYA